MKRALILVAGLLIATVAGIAVTAEPPLPPNEKFRGKSFDEWNVLAAENAISDFLGTGGLDDPTIKKVRLLPSVQTPDPDTNIFEFDIVARPGTAFCIGPWFTFGELYDNGGADDPTNAIEELVLPTTEIATMLDGEVLLEGAATELADYSFGPTFFGEPVFYDEPQFRFNDDSGNPVNAIAALWVVGIGSVYGPLPPGEHTLVHIHSSPGFGQVEDQIFIYNITVSNKK